MVDLRETVDHEIQRLLNLDKMFRVSHSSATVIGHESIADLDGHSYEVEERLQPGIEGRSSSYSYSVLQVEMERV